MKIIYITGVEELPEGLLDDPVVRKPFHMDELLYTIERVLAQASVS
jgi:hypothetical protein